MTTIPGRRSGELDFVPRAQDDLRERLGAAGYRALVEDAGARVEIDLDAGVALVEPELADGEALELQITGGGVGTLVLGRLVLREAEALETERRKGNTEGGGALVGRDEGAVDVVPLGARDVSRRR